MMPTWVRIVLILSGGVAENAFNSRVFVHPVQLRWGECDPAGIIFYPTYFLWFDAAAWNMFAQVGYHAKRMRAEHLAMPLVRPAARSNIRPNRKTARSAFAHRAWGKIFRHAQTLYAAAVRCLQLNRAACVGRYKRPGPAQVSRSPMN
jgi:hypothetical protein